MREMLEICFSGPVLPSTILLMVVAFYWLTVIIGALDLDLFNVDIDVDGDGDVEGFVGAGMAVFRFLNLGRIPFMLWMSFFALSFWLVAMLWYQASYNENQWVAAQVILRNFALALVATKILTQPLLHLVEKTRTRSAFDLIGQLCVVSTSVVDSHTGQAKLHTEASPLLLNVRARSGSMIKGDVAKIVEFDPNQHIYYVQKADSEVEA